MKKLLLLLISTIFGLLIVEIIGSTLDLRPRIWNDYLLHYKDYGWHTWHGADHVNGKHSEQTNGYKTRGKVPTKEKKIIILGDSNIETSHHIDEMPEKYLEDNFSKHSVISFGSWGWGNDQQLLHLKKNISKIKPEYVVLWFSPNDPEDNSDPIGFVGPKPTFKFKDNKLIYPKEKVGDTLKLQNFFYKFYTYRFYIAFNKKIKKLKNNLIGSKNFKFKNDQIKVCKEEFEYTNYKKLLQIYFDENMYNYHKDHKTKKPMPYNIDIESMPKKDQWISNKIDINFNNFVNKQEDMFFWLNANQSINEKYRIKLTNLILNEIEKISNENGAKFIVFMPIYLKFLPFEDDITYKVCNDGFEFEYSNLNVFKKLNQLFNNIQYKYIFEIEKDNFYNSDETTYDNFDGHVSPETTKYIMEQLTTFIKKNN